MKTKSFLAAWLLTSVVLFVLNGIFHGVVAAGFFDAHLTGLGSAVLKMKNFNPVPIVVLELVLDLCLAVIITRMRNERVMLRDAMLTGGLFYLSTAASWNLANMASLVAWPVIVTLVDVAWHFVSGLLAGWIVAKVYNRRFG